MSLGWQCADAVQNEIRQLSGGGIIKILHYPAYCIKAPGRHGDLLKPIVLYDIRYLGVLVANIVRCRAIDLVLNK